MITSVGKSLIERRRALGLCLDDVAHASKVSRQNLRWLEADELGNFPSPAYALSFLRFYGGVLDLDAEALTAQAQRQFAASQERRVSFLQRLEAFAFGATDRTATRDWRGRNGLLERLSAVLCAMALSVILAAVGLTVFG